MTIDWSFMRGDLTARMQDRGLTQAALCKAADIGTTTLSDFLAGKRGAMDLDKIDALAGALGTTVAALTGAAEDGADVIGLTADRLTEQLHNPRKAMDPDALAELAASIEQAGVLQNLVVGPVNGQGTHAVWAGARRLRAVKTLVAARRTIAGVPAAQYRIPCRVVDGDAVQVMTIAMIENLQREDMSAMDEAEAFAWLRSEAGWSTADIAAKINRTQRFVQKRLALVDKLAEPVKDALRNGEINFAKAEALTVADKEDQDEALEMAKADHWTAEELRDELLGDKHPVEDAAFDLARYTGEYHDIDGKRYFADSLQFINLQRAAAAEKVTALRAEWAWASLHVYADQGYFNSGAYPLSKDRKKAGAVVFINYGGRLSVHEGLVKQAAAKPTKAGAPAPDKPAKHFTDTHLRLARRIKTAALQDAVLARPGAALRLCVLGLLGADEVRVQLAQGDSLGNSGRGPATIAASRAAFEALGGTIGKAEAHRYAAQPRLEDAPLRRYWQHEGGALDAVATWVKLNEMSDADVLQILAAIVAGQTGSWNEYDAQLGDTPLAARVAEDLDVSMAGPGKAALQDDEYLKSAGKRHLAEIATDLGAAVMAKDTGKTLSAWIKDAALAASMADYVPRELRWGNAAFVTPAADQEEEAA